jgi:hypothetical protein
MSIDWVAAQRKGAAAAAAQLSARKEPAPSSSSRPAALHYTGRGRPPSTQRPPQVPPTESGPGVLPLSCRANLTGRRRLLVHRHMPPKSGARCSPAQRFGDRDRPEVAVSGPRR